MDGWLRVRTCVFRVAREVGTEGRLGAQASVPNVGGTWKVRLSYLRDVACVCAGLISIWWGV